MGMYDTLKGKCPSCGEEVELQSKAGLCLLGMYNLKKIPVEIANDLNLKFEEHQNKCEHCGTKFVLKVKKLPVTVKGKFVEVTDEIQKEIEERDEDYEDNGTDYSHLDPLDLDYDEDK